MLVEVTQIRLLDGREHVENLWLDTRFIMCILPARGTPGRWLVQMGGVEKLFFPMDYENVLKLTGGRTS